MRRLILVGLLIFGSANPLQAALGTAPRCLPPDALGDIEASVPRAPLPKLQPAIETTTASTIAPPIRQALPIVDAEERDYLIRTMVFEATGESEAGLAAVAHVILNRRDIGRWGDHVKDVVTAPWQFEPWMTRRREMENLSVDDPRYRRAAQIADTVLAGETADPTAGATHFLNPVIVRARRGGSLPAWAQGRGHPIGRHTFYMPDEGPVAPRLELAASTLANPLACSHPFVLQVDDSPKRVPNWPAGNLVQLDRG